MHGPWPRSSVGARSPVRRKPVPVDGATYAALAAAAGALWTDPTRLARRTDELRRSTSADMELRELNDRVDAAYATFWDAVGRATSAEGRSAAVALLESLSSLHETLRPGGAPPPRQESCDDEPLGSWQELGKRHDDPGAPSLHSSAVS
jgi:hypothetical protein